jgi:2-amino-4-hydroxy-6-hydroxymethyldihydropteridine diphosphokinase
MSYNNSQSPLAYIALGGNVGDSAKILGDVMARLEQLSRTALVKSSLWQTAPVDCPPGSPPFVNAVVALAAQPAETPESLLAKLLALEKEFGRRPKQVVNEPRRLDLDLIAFGREMRSLPSLTLPHPRAHMRQFVLRPLSEIAPDLVLPGQIKTVAQLLATTPTKEVLVRLSP